MSRSCHTRTCRHGAAAPSLLILHFYSHGMPDFMHHVHPCAYRYVCEHQQRCGTGHPADWVDLVTFWLHKGLFVRLSPCVALRVAQEVRACIYVLTVSPRQASPFWVTSHFGDSLTLYILTCKLALDYQAAVAVFWALLSWDRAQSMSARLSPTDISPSRTRMPSRKRPRLSTSTPWRYAFG